MGLLFGKGSFFKIISIFLIGVASYLYLTYYNTQEAVYEMALVSRGTVSVVANVSGKVEAKKSARLNFPVVGTVYQVFAREGETVPEGTILASLVQNSLVAEYDAALQNMKYQQSIKDELIRGPLQESREVIEANVAIAEGNLERAKREYAERVEGAYKTLLSTDIEALSVNKLNDDVPPTISGTYTCDKEGSYTLSVFRSSSPTDYSFKLSGLDEGVYTGYTDSPTPFGNCGLSIQFDADEIYRNGDWTISIPNTRSSFYQTNLNAYTLALKQQENAVSSAEQALTLAQHSQTEFVAPPSNESLRRVNASLEEARSALTAREALIADYTIRAPFEGTVTNVDIKVGEVASGNRSISILANGSYELKARIPEVDVRNVRVGNGAFITFDAAPDEPLFATIEYISQLSSEVDGVAYYDARFKLQEEPVWIREGLNADVEILIDRKKNALRIPKHFITTDDEAGFVFIKNETTITKTPITTGLIGNDGYVEVTNLPEGTVVVIP